MQFSRYKVLTDLSSVNRVHNFRYGLYLLMKNNLQKRSGSLLLSHTVASIVSSAAQGLTIVFGMGTGVSPERIATGKDLIRIRTVSLYVLPLNYKS